MSVYVEHNTKESDLKKLQTALEDIDDVTRVTYVTPQQARANYAQANRNNPRALDALNLADAKFPGTFRINVEDINDTSGLTKFTETNELYKRFMMQTGRLRLLEINVKRLPT